MVSQLLDCGCACEGSLYNHSRIMPNCCLAFFKIHGHAVAHISRNVCAFVFFTAFYVTFVHAKKSLSAVS